MRKDESSRRSVSRGGQAPRNTDAILSTLYASTPVLIGVKDRDSRIISANPAVFALIGMTEQDVLGRGDISLLGGRLSARAIEEDRQVMRTGETMSTVELAGGRTWDVTKAPWRGKGGEIAGVVVVAYDITARTRAEEALRAAEARLREHAASLEWRVRERTAQLRTEHNFIAAILDTVPALVVVLDRDGRIVRFNRACEEASGRSFAEVEGRGLFDLLLPPGEAAGVREVFARLREGDFPHSHENHWLRADGSARLIAWNNTCLTGPSGAVDYVIGTGIDVTEQRRAERAARTQFVELAQLHRLHAAGEIAALVAHQLNQPLTAIGAYAESSAGLLRAETIDRAALGRNLERIIEQAQRGARAIRELRAYLARGSGTRERASLADIAQAAIRVVEPEAREHGVRLVLQPGERVPPVDAEVLHIEQVLANLLQNGVEAIRDAGMPSGTVALRLERHGEMTRVTVSDSGPGFDAETVRHLFDRFYTTKPKGVGMGLSISRSIVEAHGGRLWAVPGRGGTLHFTLPLAQ